MVTPNALPPDVLGKIRTSITERTGLNPQDWVLEARVQERMRERGVDQAHTYADLLGGRPELTALIELLRVGETRFYRHESQMRAVVELVMPALRRGVGPARLWSAGCATGEEAYTLAMLLSRGLDGHRSFKILASDISPASIERARAGIYREAAIGTLPHSYRTGFERSADGNFQVSPALRALVEFEERNLATGGYPGSFDLIFCRNVLIYFEESAKDAALRRLVKALKPGAFLFLGYSESLRDVAGLEVVSSDECTVYRRKMALDSAVNRPSTGVRVLMPTPLDSANTQPATSVLVALQGQYSNGQRLQSELDVAFRKATTHVVVDLDGADYLGQETADVLRNMREKAMLRGIALRWCATRAGHLRFLRRHNLSDGDKE